MATDAQLQQQIDDAHILGKNRARHRDAYEGMMAVADEAEESQLGLKVTALQQAGVYLANSGQHEEAILRYDWAYRLAGDQADGITQGNILRDRARSQHALGETPDAIAGLKEAMKLHADTRIELALDQGFLGRIIFDAAWSDRWTSHLTGSLRRKRRADMESGIRLMEGADGTLSPRFRDDVTAEQAHDLRNLQLYNKLHLAAALKRAARNKREREAAQRLVRDCLRLVADGHGNVEHKVRAYALLCGGWRADRALQKLRPVIRQVVAIRNLVRKAKP